MILNYVGAKLEKRVFIMCLFMFSLLFVSTTITFRLLEPEWTLGECLWFFIVTLFSVGYGNVTPTNEASKLCNCVFILLSVLFIGWALSIIIDYMVAENEPKKKRKRSGLGPLDVDMTPYQTSDDEKEDNNGGDIRTSNTYYFDEEEKYNDFEDRNEIPIEYLNHHKNIDKNVWDWAFMRLLVENALVLVMIIGFGVLFFVIYENWKFIDGLQFMCATITTV